MADRVLADDFRQDATITFAVDAGQLQLNVMEPVIGQAMFESVSLLGNAMANLRDRCIDGITANREKGGQGLIWPVLWMKNPPLMT